MWQHFEIFREKESHEASSMLPFGDECLTSMSVKICFALGVDGMKKESIEPSEEEKSTLESVRSLFVFEYFTVYQTVPPLPYRQQVDSSMSMDKSTPRVNRSSS